MNNTEAIQFFAVQTKNGKMHEAGYLTTLQRFVHAHEAVRIAVSAGQIKNESEEELRQFLTNKIKGTKQ